MAIRTLSNKSSILSLIVHPSHTLSLLTAHPLAAVHAPLFEQRRVEGMQVLTQEIQLSEACVVAQARIDVADDNLDHMAGRVSKQILILTDDDTSAPLYTMYFHGKSVSDFKKPKLGAQLTAMRVWVESLQQSPFPALHALAPEVEAAVAEADAAVLARDQARQRMRDFRSVGARRQWVDGLNATRKEVHGALSKLPHEHLMLPTDFADRFFLRAPGRDESELEQEAPETSESLQARLAELLEEVAGVEARLAELAAAEQAAQQAAEARKVREAQLAELDRAAAKLEAERAALRATLEAESA